MVWVALKEARKTKANLATSWLDIANAYGSVLQKLIIFAFQRYGIPPKWINLIMLEFFIKLIDGATNESFMN